MVPATARPPQEKPHLYAKKRRKRTDYTFLHQFNEKPSIYNGLPRKTESQPSRTSMEGLQLTLA